MLLKDLVIVHADDERLLLQLTNMAGDAYLEELWVRELLSGLPTGSEGSDRERFLSRAIILNQCLAAAPYEGIHCTHDGAGLLVAYQQSELNGTSWDALMQKAAANLKASVLSDEEAAAYDAQRQRMASATVRDWVLREEAPGDFLHIVLVATDPDHRGSGDFRRMVKAVLDYADEAQLPVFTEVYSDALEETFADYGFKPVHQFKAEEVALTERCLRRDPEPRD